MTRYFFNLRYGSEAERMAVDPEGEELVNGQTVRKYTLQIIRDLIARPSSFAVRDWLNCSFEIENEKGELILTVPFRDILAPEDVAPDL